MIHLSKTVGIFGVVAGMLLCVAMASADVAIEKKGDKVSKVTMSNETGKIQIARKLWSNTILTTASGKTQVVIDPFYYSASWKKADGKTGNAYWNKPENFDFWKFSESKDAERADTTILNISAAPPTFGLRKDVTIALEGKENVAYVFNRCTALEDMLLAIDRATIYLYYPGRDYTIIVDGKEVLPDPKKPTVISNYIIFQNKKTLVSTAVIFMDHKVQEFPGASKGRMGELRFYLRKNEDGSIKQDGANIAWSKGSGKWKKGDARIQQYMLVWGDGDIKEKVEALSVKALVGELNSKVAKPKEE
jgi:hypothetical protein